MSTTVTQIAKVNDKIEASRSFLEYLVRWQDALGPIGMRAVVADAGGAENVAVITVDVIKGFAEKGALAGPRVAAIVSPIRRLLEDAHAAGVRSFVFMQDTHPADSPEFESWPAHCVEGTEEAEMVGELASLPFAEAFTVFPKTSVDSAQGTALGAWLDARPNLRAIIVVGDCTDICVFQLAMHLKVRHNVGRHGYRVIVPADSVDTYDLPVPVAEEVGAMAHDGDLLHRVFLHQMALNGIQVVRAIDT
ncbi:MAG: cysteine hydrolase [Armatimonadetes bacterium]|nr:cysteine hydrolase [Armatimonadota bacterium]